MRVLSLLLDPESGAKVALQSSTHYINGLVFFSKATEVSNVDSVHISTPATSGPPQIVLMCGYLGTLVYSIFAMTAQPIFERAIQKESCILDGYCFMVSGVAFRTVPPIGGLFDFLSLYEMPIGHNNKLILLAVYLHKRFYC